MSRRLRISLYLLGGLAGAAAILVLTGIVVLQSQWFRGQVRARLIREIENATGGRIETGPFRFNWRTMTASVRDLVLHGTEAQGQAPLFRVAELRLGIKVLSVWEKRVDLRSVSLVHPELNLIVYPDGSTNMPEPRFIQQSGRNPLGSVFDLAVREFSVADGSIQTGFRKFRLEAAGEDLHAQLMYRRRYKDYQGEISFHQLSLNADNLPRVPFDFEGRFELGRDRLSIANASLHSGGSYLSVHGALANFAQPRSQFDYAAHIRLEDLPRDFRTPIIGRRGTIELSGKAVCDGRAGFSSVGKLEGRRLEAKLSETRIDDIGVTSGLALTPQGMIFGGLSIRALEGAFHGRAELPHFNNLHLSGELSGISLSKLMRFSGGHYAGWNGIASGPIEFTAKTASGIETARADVSISRATGTNAVEGRVIADYDKQNDRLKFGQSHLTTLSSRIEFSGVLGKHLNAYFESTDLEDIAPVVSLYANGWTGPLPIALRNGFVRFRGAIIGPLRQPSIQGHFDANHIVFHGHNYDSLETDAVLSSSGVEVRNAALSTMQTQAHGDVEIGLHNWQLDDTLPVTGRFSVHTVDAAQAMAEAGVKFPWAIRSGAATAGIRLAGTLGAPRVDADIQAVNVVAFDQSFVRLAGQVEYAPGRVRFLSCSAGVAGGQVNFSASYNYSGVDRRRGALEFRLSTSKLSLAELNAVRAWNSDLGGRLDATVAGSAHIAASGFRPDAINGSVLLHDFAVRGQRFGTLAAVANTSGSNLSIGLNGEMDGAKVNGTSRCDLSGSYPATAHVEFAALRVSNLLARFRNEGAAQIPFEGFASGSLEFSGSVFDKRSWKGTIQVPVFEMQPKTGTGLKTANLGLHNTRPILIDFDESGAQIRQASLRGNETNLELSGGATFGAKNPWDLRLRGGVNLALLRNFDPRLYASGDLDLDIALRGTLAHPEPYGRIVIKAASVNFSGIPNGISNANGVVLLYRDRATIDRLAAESGGGKIAVTGFLGLDTAATFHFHVRASEVRVRYPAGISSTVDGTLSLTGTIERSLLSGDVTITRVGVSPRSDLASILGAAASASRASEPSTSFEQGMRLDVHFMTSPQVRFEASLTRDIRASADLHLRGSPARPLLLGRVLVNQGDISFFGTRYTISSGQVVFTNASKIEPTINFDLETKVRGVDITLHLSGPVNKLNVTYRSDPPLPFSEIVSVLTTGREPSTASGVSTSQSQISQSWQQAGATALLGQAISNPVSGRLQRFFGVSQFRINPETGGSTTTNTAARVTIEQRIANNLTLTYVTDLSRAQAQLVRMELDLTRNWSAIALRDENGEFGVDMQYKKQFK